VIDELPQRLRALPAVDRLAQAVLDSDGATATKAEATAVARATLERRRAELLAGSTDDPDLVGAACALLRPSLRRVLNGTGVVVHTNLGRAPLHPDAAAAAAAASLGYVNLEFDLGAGGRGARDVHVAGLLTELTGAHDALVVNNGAAAVLLAVAAIAGPGGAVAVSRGQAVEIGGGFRIPEVVAQAGARLAEVGTTNRTRLADYRRAVHDGAGAVLRVHPSNFRTTSPPCGGPSPRAPPWCASAATSFSGVRRPVSSWGPPTPSRRVGATRWPERCGSAGCRSRRSRRPWRCTATRSARGARSPFSPCWRRTRTCCGGARRN
jgi:hypothetical protein